MKVPIIGSISLKLSKGKEKKRKEGIIQGEEISVPPSNHTTARPITIGYRDLFPFFFSWLDVSLSNGN